MISAPIGVRLAGLRMNGQPAAIAGGRATYSLNIPNDMGVVVLQLAVQGINLAPGETGLGAVLTNGLEGTAGL